MKPVENSFILGLGSFVPENVVDNTTLSEKVDTSDEWIRTRTGITGKEGLQNPMSRLAT